LVTQWSVQLAKALHVGTLVRISLYLTHDAAKVWILGIGAMTEWTDIVRLVVERFSLLPLENTIDNHAT
jgi:hypothetical protein